MTEHKVSIIVPVYKVESYLPQCLDSIISQTYSDLEIILVDDGSPDRCGEICDQYATRDSRISVIHKSNGGLVSAWKAGLAKASGEYIAFIDSDDYVDSDYIERLVGGLTNEEVDMVCCHCTQFGYGEPKLSKLNALDGERAIDREILERILHDHLQGARLVGYSRWAKLIKRELATKVSARCSEDITCGEDQQLTIQCVALSHKVNCIDYYGYYYRSNPNSIMNSYKNNMWTESKTLDRIMRRVELPIAVDNWHTQCNTALIMYACGSIKQELDYKKKGYKRTVKEIMTDNELVLAFADYYVEGMSRFYRLLSSAVKSKSYTRVRCVLWALKLYLKIK